MSYQKLKEWAPLTEEEIEKYWPIVSQVAKKFMFSKPSKSTYIEPFTSQEDIENELYTALLEAIRTFDPNHPKQASIETCIYTRCSLRLIDFMRANYWIKRTAYRSLKEDDNVVHIQTNSETIDYLKGELSINEDIGHNFKIRDFGEYLFKNLGFTDNNKIQDMLTMFFIEHKSPKEISDKYNITANYLYHVIRQAKPELERRVKKQNINIETLLKKEDDSTS